MLLLIFLVFFIVRGIVKPSTPTDDQEESPSGTEGGPRLDDDSETDTDTDTDEEVEGAASKRTTRSTGADQDAKVASANGAAPPSWSTSTSSLPAEEDESSAAAANANAGAGAGVGAGVGADGANDGAIPGDEQVKRLALQSSSQEGDSSLTDDSYSESENSNAPYARSPIRQADAGAVEETDLDGEADSDAAAASSESEDENEPLASQPVMGGSARLHASMRPGRDREDPPSRDSESPQLLPDATREQEPQALPMQAGVTSSAPSIDGISATGAPARRGAEPAAASRGQPVVPPPLPPHNSTTASVAATHGGAWKNPRGLQYGQMPLGPPQLPGRDGSPEDAGPQPDDDQWERGSDVAVLAEESDIRGQDDDRPDLV